MSMGPPPRAVEDLPVGDTMKAAYHSVFGGFAELFKAVAVPLLVSFLLYALQRGAGDGSAIAILAELLLLLPYTLFAVTWHRFVLLEQAAMPTPIVPVWQTRHWRFLGYTLIVTAISYGFSLLYAPLIAPLVAGDTEVVLWQPMLLIFLLLFGTYVILRLSFVFPAAAVDESYGFADSWRHTKDQGLRLMAAMFLTLLPATVGFLVVLQFVLTFASAVSGSTDPAALGPVAQVVDVVLRYILIALSLSVISTAFKTCTGWVPDLSGPPLTPLPGDPPDDDEDT